MKIISFKRQVEKLAQMLRMLKNMFGIVWICVLHLPPYLTIPGPQALTVFFWHVVFIMQILSKI